MPVPPVQQIPVALNGGFGPTFRPLADRQFRIEPLKLWPGRPFWQPVGVTQNPT
jgi:hypothetical protein